jgi:hypothetical protein
LDWVRDRERERERSDAAAARADAERRRDGDAMDAALRQIYADRQARAE